MMKPPIFGNTPNRLITAVEDGKQYWVSRSVAVVGIPFFTTLDGTFVPLGKRAGYMALEPEKWGLPCGFLDFGESVEDAMRREIWEELGIRLEKGSVFAPDAVISEPNPAENDTVSMLFIINRSVDELPVLSPQCGEVVSTCWLNVDGDAWKSKELAFNHRDIIDWARNLGPST